MYMSSSGLICSTVHRVSFAIAECCIDSVVELSPKQDGNSSHGDQLTSSDRSNAQELKGGQKEGQEHPERTRTGRERYDEQR